MKRIEKFCLFIIVIIISTFSNLAKESRAREEIEQIKVGNFALPGSQQPGPLVGFGQNILDKGDLQLFGYVDQLKGPRKNFKEVAPSLLYAITDKFSIFIELPVAAHFSIENFSSRGLEDLLIQFEYAVYVNETSTRVNEVTCVANMGFATGSAFKEPPTGFGAPSFFLGFTASHIATDWYCFTSFGTILPTSHKNTKFGNQFLYQCGLSRNIRYAPDKWVLNWMVELDGTYKQRNKLLGFVDRNSGGNDIIFGPSLWFSTQRLIAQLGISGVVFQHLFGVQPKDRYFIAANVGWKF